MSIQPLPPHVIAQIKSSTTITNLNGVVNELAKNSLDANATRLEITIDYARGGCSLEDDGLGIEPLEFAQNGGLGKLYHSSKLGTHTPLHGGRGTFLALLSALSLLTIASRHHLHRSHNALSMHRSEVVARHTPAPPQHHLTSFNHGTRVTVRDLFGSMPVRVKQRAIASEKSRGNLKEWEDLKRDMVLLLLSWNKNVAVTLREAGTDQKLSIRSNKASEIAEKAGIARICNILSQAALITPDEKASWVSVSASTPKLKVQGAISLDPCASRHVQFLSLGIQPIPAVHGQSIFHDEINRLFANSAFGNEEEAEALSESERARRARDARYKSDGYTNRELKGGKKGVDRWPMFYINIQQDDAPKNIDVDLLDDGKNSLSSIMELLQAMILKFLTKNHFRPRAVRGRRTTESVKTSGSMSRDPTSNSRVSPAKPPPSSSPSKKRKRSSATPKGILKSHSRTLDPLGTNIKLPSFRNSASTPESPFDAWSRVKTGSTRPKHIPPSSESLGTDIERPATAPPHSQTPSSSIPPRCPTADLPRRSGTPLLSKTGKLLRRPFEDIPIHPSPKPGTPVMAKETPQTLHGNEDADPDADDSDEIITWLNPITKIESRINKRTGLTIPASKLNHGTRKLTMPHQNPALSLSSAKNNEPPTPWLNTLLKQWSNPIFPPTEPSIPQIQHDHHDHHCTQPSLSLDPSIQGKITKHALRSAQIINQVDNKFILVEVKSTPTPNTNTNTRGEGEMLVLIDQHAADERIRIESLLAQLFTPPDSFSLHQRSSILTTPLDKPLVFEISGKEVKLLEMHGEYFTSWGIFFDVSPPESRKNRDGEGKEGMGMGKEMGKIEVNALPGVIAERCKLHPDLLISLIRTELWKIHDNPVAPLPQFSSSNPSTSDLTEPTNGDPNQNPAWLSHLSNIPQPLLDMLNSRACRSAIMFNDVLTREQCEVLVRRLGGCRFPWFCAHGRPGFVVLGGVGGLGEVDGEDGGGDGGFGRAFGLWRESKRGVQG